MDYKDVADRIIGLKNADLEFRNELIKNGFLGNGYHKEMEALHNKNAETLNQIIDTIGYPTTDKVGKEASEAAWLIIQHSVSSPDFMEKCAKLLANAVDENKVNQINLAYLTDRIAVLKDNLQLYGTQFDWNKNGEMCPNPFDDLNKVNQRRMSIGLNTLEEQIQIMRKRVKNENQLPPIDFEERKKEYDNWRKSVTWIK